MKKMIKMFVVLFASVVCLSGCFMPKAMYEQADADQVTAKGREMMQVWLAENMPDAELTECKVYIVRTLYDGNEYLSDYASGYIRTGKENTWFMINTVTGAVYFETGPNAQTTLNEAAEAYIQEITGLTAAKGEDHYFLCNVMVPVRDGASVNEIPGVEYFGSQWFGVCVLPAGTDTENLDAFVRDPASRPMLEIEGYFLVPEGADPSEYDLDVIKRQLKEEHGLQFAGLLSFGTYEAEEKHENK